MTVATTTKLVARLSASGRMGIGTVHLDQDGVKTELTRVTEIRADAEGNFEVKMWTEDFDAEVEISELTAQAILRTNATKALSFISAEDAGYLKELRAILVQGHKWPEDDHRLSEDDLRLKPLDKILVELARREEIPL